MRLRARSGFGLIILVMLIGVTGLILSASSWFLIQQVRQTQLRVDQTKAHYLAQAAAVRAVWNWYTFLTTGESREWNTVNTTITGNQIFKAGLTSAGVYLQSNYAYVAPIAHTGFVNVRNLTTAGNKTAGTTTLAATVPAAGAQVGDFLVIVLAMDDGGGAMLNPPAVDTQGNLYAVASDVTNATHVRTVIIYGLVETALVNPNTITCRWTNNVTAKAMCVREFTGPTHLDTQTTATGVLPGNPITTATITPSQAHSLVMAAIGVEGPSGDAVTAGTGYTIFTEASSGNTGLTDVTMTGEYKATFPTAITTHVGDGTNSNATRFWASAVAAFIGRAHWYTPTATTNRRLRAWTLQNINATAANTITATHMKVSWTGGGAARLREIRLNNASVWTGTATTGTDNDITDTALAGDRARWSGINTYLQWDNNGPADPVTVTVQFTFAGNSATTDDRSHEIRLWEGCQTVANCDGLGTVLGIPGERTFTVTATGQVNQTTDKYFKVMKTVKAVVSGAPGLTSAEIVQWDEGDKNIP